VQSGGFKLDQKIISDERPLTEDCFSVLEDYFGKVKRSGFGILQIKPEAQPVGADFALSNDLFCF